MLSASRQIKSHLTSSSSLNRRKPRHKIQGANVPPCKRGNAAFAVAREVAEPTTRAFLENIHDGL